MVHWGYGTGWGAARGLLGAIGLPGSWAGAAHLAMVWGGELVMLPRLEVAPPVKEWGAKELVIDAWHHSVYTTATSLAFAFLSRPERTSKSAACRLGSSRRSR